MARQELTPVDPASLPDALELAAEEAAEAAGGFEDHHFRVAGLSLRLKFAGKALVSPVIRPLAHLRAAPAPRPSLAIRIWDSESTGVEPPRPRAEDGAVRGYLGEADEGFFERDAACLSALDASRSEGFLWVRSVADDRGLDRAAPLSSILRSWLAKSEIQLVHAAGVGTPDGCVLVVGGTAAGKSSAALACVAAGLGCIGDDTCLISAQDPPSVLSLYSSAQADASTLDRLALGHGTAAAGGKPLAFLPEAALLREAPLRAIAVARLSPRRSSRLTRASPGDALAALGPTSILRMAGPAEHTLGRLARVVEAAPCHRLEVGTDPASVAGALRTLL